MDTNLTGRFRFNENDELVSISFSEYIFLLTLIELNYQNLKEVIFAMPGIVFLVRLHRLYS